MLTSRGISWCNFCVNWRCIERCVAGFFKKLILFGDMRNFKKIGSDDCDPLSWNYRMIHILRQFGS